MIEILLNWFVWLMPHLIIRSLYWSFVAALAYFSVVFMTIPFPTAHDFEVLGCDMLHLDRGRFKHYFGVEPIVVSKLWRELYSSSYFKHIFLFSGVGGPKPAHLLWALLHLRQKFQEEMFAHDLDVSFPEFRKWSWLYATGIAHLAEKFVVWESRLPTSGSIPVSPLVSVGSMAFNLWNVGQPFDPDHPTFSMLYEVAISFRTGEVVAFSGPFDEMPVGLIFRNGLKLKLKLFEKVAADRAYAGESVVMRDKYATLRHEVLFDRLKSWDALGKVFMESVDKHRIAFGAVLVIEQVRSKMLVDVVPAPELELVQPSHDEKERLDFLLEMDEQEWADEQERLEREQEQLERELQFWQGQLID